MKLPISLVVLVLFAQSAFAQFHFGIKGGASLVNMRLEQPLISANDKSYRLSYQAGCYAVHRSGKQTFFRPELLYTNKGFRAEATLGVAGSTSEAYAIHLHYLSIPFLAGVSLTKHFAVLLGPEVSYLVAARSRSGSESFDVRTLWDERLDIGLVGEFNYLLSEKVDIGLRYIHGMRNVTNLVVTDLQGQPAEEVTSQNRVFQLSLAYQLK